MSEEYARASLARHRQRSRCEHARAPRMRMTEHLDMDCTTYLSLSVDPICVSCVCAPGAGRGGGVQRDMMDGWLLRRPLFPLAVRSRGVAAHGRPLPVGKTRELYLFPVFFNTTN